MTQTQIDVHYHAAALETYAAILQAETDGNRAALDIGLQDPDFMKLQTTHPEVLEGVIEEAQVRKAEEESARDGLIQLRDTLRQIATCADEAAILAQRRMMLHEQLIQVVEKQLNDG
jgi:hypothetical protein